MTVTWSVAFVTLLVEKTLSLSASVLTKAVCAVIIIDGKSIVKLQIETAFSSECEHVLSIFLTNSPIPGENGIFQQAEVLL